MARSFASPGAFARFLGLMPLRIQENQEHFMRQAARLVQREARSYIGTYQPAAPPFVAWAPLAYTTLHGGRTATGQYFPGKIALGYAPPDNPLLRTGAMRASIQHRVSVGRHHAEAEIGSNSQVAVWQELGTARIPPRSFLGSAAARNADAIADLLGRAGIAALFDEGGGSTDIDLPY